MAEIKDRIATLEHQLSKLRERRRVQESRRQRAEAQEAKKADLKRRLLVGSVVLAKVELGEIRREEFNKWMDDGSVTDDDRKLLRLPHSSASSSGLN